MKKIREQIREKIGELKEKYGETYHILYMDKNWPAGNKKISFLEIVMAMVRNRYWKRK